MKMFNSMRLRLLAAGILSASLLVGCGSDSSPNANTPTVTNGSLTAALGALSGATCVVRNAAATALTTVTTSADGTIALDLETTDGDFPLIVSCTGGSYFDEANPDAAAFTPNTATIKSIVPNLATLTSVGNNLAVTTLTDLAVELYNSLPAGNKTVETALASLNEIVRVLAPALGANGGGVNILAAPTPVSSGTSVVPNSPAGLYASYLAGLAQIAKDKGVSPGTLGAQLAASVAAGTAIDPVVVNNLVAKTTTFATAKNPALGTTAGTGTTGAGGAAVKPTPTTGTGATGGTGGTGAGGTGG
ncbi:hypothetical protein [Zhongshania sp. BJYM1]|uniref:hypothetical protein n=1 Tax=Zhongshania aquatica TaxID=2965069 RepID=UPI0022B50E62|nr:hypothetical protein [Marortus sp. BJYM1]